MATLYTSLKPLLFQDNNRRNKKYSDLELSSSLESITKHLKVKTKLSDLSKSESSVIIYGEPGCGRTTLLLEICDAFLGSKLKDSEILGVRVRAGCTEESLWNFLSEISKNKQDKDTASLLSQTTAKLSKKYKAAQAFISSNFKLVCVDDAYSDGGIVWSHLSQLLREANTCVLVVCTRKEAPFIQATLTEQPVLSVELKGMSVDSFKKSLNHELPNWSSSEEQQLRIFSLLNGNPTALKIFVNIVNKFKLPPQSLDCSFLSCSEHQNEQETYSVSSVLQFSFEHLTACEHQVFDQLSQLREPLPMVNVSEEVETLVKLGLVNKEAIGLNQAARHDDVIYSVSIASCLHWSSLQLLCSSVGIVQHRCEVQVHFSAFNAWHTLLSEKLCQLITDAEGNAWPFVPEKWQYISNVGAEEKYNIKELIMAKNSVVPYLTEQDILEECLFHALKDKKYSIVAALVFVMDRFTYWRGSSHTTIQLVEYLKANSPCTPIAPQLLIRKVRVMKNTGDLQGAEQALNELLVQKSHVGEWVYKNMHDHQLVSAVCIQIKGAIQYNLGQWVQGAKLLLESLILFGTLPIPDTKGISSSLSALAKCLQQMSVSEYVPLAQMYGLAASHPLLQAYYCSYESAIRSQYTPLFYSRHKCHAAEYMLRYSQLIPDKAQRQAHLNICIEDFKDSIQAHQDLQTLTSREEFFVFACAVYKLGIAHQEMSSQDSIVSIQRAQHINKISKLLYEHYCLFTGAILLDEEIAKLIAHCLNLVDGGHFCDGELDQTGRLTDVCDVSRPSNSSTVLSSGTNKELDAKVTCSWEMPKTDCQVNAVQASANTVNSEFTFANHEAVLKVRSDGRSVTDKLKEKQEHMTADILSAYSRKPQPEKKTNGSGLIVDRDSDTMDSRSVTMETVDRSVVTQHLEQETVPLPCDGFLPSEVSNIQPKLQGLNLDSSQRVQGAIVWRFDSLHNEWRGEKTLAYVGDLLELEEGKEGAQRNAFMVEFINQDDPFAKYVAKCYRKSKNVKQYQQDVICQMTARYYATLFNQQLYHADLNVGHIQFLPVVLLQLVSESGSLSGVYNVEPYMAGEFVKFTNNFNFVRRESRASDLVLAFSHFTYQASSELLIIVDIQGWTPAANQTGFTFLTDPQIHSVVYKCFGTGNLHQDGIDSFWKHMHPCCNDLCKKLQLGVANAAKLDQVAEAGLTQTLLAIGRTMQDSVDEMGSRIFDGLKKNSTSWVLLNVASLYWRVKGDTAEAIKCLRQALYFSPPKARDVAHVGLASILLREGQLDDTAVVIKKALEISPSLALGHFILGNVFGAQSKIPEAIQHYLLALQLEPGFTPAVERLKIIQCVLWKQQQALEKEASDLRKLLTPN